MNTIHMIDVINFRLTLFMLVEKKHERK